VPLRFLVLDLDGTLCETRADIARAVNAALASHGLPALAMATVSGFVGDGVGRLVDRVLAAVGADPARAPAVVASLLQHYLAHPVVETTPYPHAAEVLDRLAPLPLAVVSNKPGELCRRILDHFGLCDRFAAVLGGDWGGPRKPDPAPLLAVAARLGLAPADGAMVGDSPVDLVAGRAAGGRTVAALYGYRPAAELLALRPDAAIGRLVELPDVLATLGA
jgi:phosphoglycolate phosphatase